MNKYIVFFVFLLAVNFGFAQPKLVIIGGNTYDWGKSNPAQSPLKAKIQIKNTGTELLKIIEVKPGCGCTNAPLDKNEIAPNDVATMEISLNISSYTGDVTKSVRITSNDPANGDTYLFLKTNVFRPVIVEPSNYLGKSIINMNQETTFEYKLKNQTDKPVKVTDITLYPNQTISNLSKGEILPPNTEKSYTIKYTPTEPGRLNGSIKISTDNKTAEEIIIYFYGNIVRDEELNKSK